MGRGRFRASGRRCTEKRRLPARGSGNKAESEGWREICASLNGRLAGAARWTGLAGTGPDTRTGGGGRGARQPVKAREPGSRKRRPGSRAGRLSSSCGTSRSARMRSTWCGQPPRSSRNAVPGQGDVGRRIGGSIAPHGIGEPSARAAAARDPSACHPRRLGIPPGAPDFGSRARDDLPDPSHGVCPGRRRRSRVEDALRTPFAPPGVSSPHYSM